LAGTPEKSQRGRRHARLAGEERGLAVGVDDSVLALIETIYDAALDEALWPSVLRQMIAITDSQAASFYTLDSAEQLRLPIFEYINFDAGFIDEYLDCMTPYDPTNQYIAAHPGERIVHDASFITEAEKDRHLYYDWHHRYSDTRHRVVGVVSPLCHVQSGIALHRTRAKGDFEPQTIRQFSALFRHIERALEIGTRLGTLGCLQQVSLDLLDRNPLGIFLLDNYGRIILANRAARALGEADDGIVLAAEGIVLCRALDDRRLQRLIAEALKTSDGMDAPPGGAMLAKRPSRKRPYSILVSPLSRATFAMTRLRPAACIVIADPEKSGTLPSDRLRTLYGLTPAEARLATRLATGEDLRAAAASLGIGYATARTQLSGIFRKTETSRQGELIMLLLKTVPLLAS
jgi:DNA-binding CsgD family transcriptional regulator/PAS domain-containing protein